MSCPICHHATPESSIDSVCPRCALAQALKNPEADAFAPSRIEGYELLHELGHGAMGVVWLAREKALDRLVAVKLLAAHGTPALAARLLREGQAAARLNHPNIVAIHALGGDTATPFLAMDFAEGGSLREAVGDQPLAPPAAVALVAKLASALAHAHAAGVLHRDLKPANVLLSAAGEPQLADFGLAGPLDGGGDLTRPDQLAGTPAYLAPELLEGPGRASPRSDVYGLGAILYFCLTARAPFVGESPAAILHDVQSAEPLAPRILRPAIPRDVETICLKCLQKSPAARYATADALGEDLRRCQRGEPIAARPVGVPGKILRWGRRRPAAATALGLATAILVGLAVGGPVVALRLERSRRAATDAASVATAITNFLQNDLLAQASPENQPDRDLKLRTVLDASARGIDGRFPGQPLVEASIRETLAQTYATLGDFGAARHQLSRALALRASPTGDEDPARLKTRSLLATTLIGLGQYEAAARLAAATAREQAQRLGPHHRDTLETRITLASARRLTGRYAEAEAILTQALADRRRAPDPGAPEILTALDNLAAVHFDEGHYATAEALYGESLALHRRFLGPDHPRTLTVMNDLSVVYERESHAGAETLARETLAARQRVLGPEHPATLQSMNNLASICRDLGQADEAISLLSAALEIGRRIYGPEHPETLTMMLNLAVLLRDHREFGRAETLCLQTLELRRRISGAEHPSTLSTLAMLVAIHKFGGDLAAAEPLGREVVALRQRVLGPLHPDTLWSEGELGDILLLAGHPAEAGELLQQTLDLAQKISWDPWKIALTESRGGAALLALGRFAEAEPLLLAGAHGLERETTRIPAFLHFELGRSRARVFELYMRWNQPQLAAAWKN